MTRVATVRAVLAFRPPTAFAVALSAAALALPACSAGEVGNAVADQCLREAERIQDPGARAAAEEGCRAASDGNVDAGDAKRSARERCLRATERIANPQARADAEQRCNDIR